MYLSSFSRPMPIKIEQCQVGRSPCIVVKACVFQEDISLNHFLRPSFGSRIMAVCTFIKKRNVVTQGWFPTIYGDSPWEVLYNRILHVVNNKKPSINDFYQRSKNWLNANKLAISETTDPKMLRIRTQFGYMTLLEAQKKKLIHILDTKYKGMWSVELSNRSISRIQTASTKEALMKESIIAFLVSSIKSSMLFFEQDPEMRKEYYVLIFAILVGITKGFAKSIGEIYVSSTASDPVKELSKTERIRNTFLHLVKTVQYCIVEVFAEVLSYLTEIYTCARFGISKEFWTAVKSTILKGVYKNFFESILEGRISLRNMDCIKTEIWSNFIVFWRAALKGWVRELGVQLLKLIWVEFLLMKLTNEIFGIVITNSIGTTLGSIFATGIIISIFIDYPVYPPLSELQGKNAVW